MPKRSKKLSIYRELKSSPREEDFVLLEMGRTMSQLSSRPEAQRVCESETVTGSSRPAAVMKPIPGRLQFQAHSSLSLLIQIGHSRSDIVIKTPLSGWELARAKRSLIVHSTPRSTFNSTFARSFAAPPLHLTSKASFREMPSRALFFPQQNPP